MRKSSKGTPRIRAPKKKLSGRQAVIEKFVQELTFSSEKPKKKK